MRIIFIVQVLIILNEKLNNKIKKDLDANQIQRQSINKNNVTMSKQPIIQSQKKNYKYQTDSNNSNSKRPPQPTAQTVAQQTNNNNQWSSILKNETQKKQQWMNGGWKGSSLKLISNKIHLKNLQMKVGNSIRQTQKLKRIYQGSLSSLTKKAQDLQDEINKLARQCEYYRIEAELLNNIYKADFYKSFNSDWVGLYRNIKMVQNNQQQPAYNDSHRHGTQQQMRPKIISEQQLSNSLQRQQFQQQSFQLYKFMNSRPNQQQKNFLQKTKNKRYTETNVKNRNNNRRQQQLSEQRRLMSNNNNSYKVSDSIGFGEINSQNYPMAVRFLSFSYKHNILGNINSSKSNNSGWYSTLYPKSKVNKLLQIIESQSIDKQTMSHKFLSTNKNLPSLNNNKQYHPQQQQQHMTQKQLFLLPQSLVKFVLSSLQKQQIQQNNKLQSLRKQQKQQRKNNLQLTQKITLLNIKKNQLKRIVDEQFAQFFIKNVQRLDIISSAVNNNNTNIMMKMGRKLQTNDENYSNIHNKSRKQLLTRHVPSLSNTRTNQTKQLLTLTKSPQQQQQSTNPTNTHVHTSIYERKHEADQLLICGLYQKQLIQQISRQQQLLQQQFRINQQYKQKIIDRNEQQSKEIKVLQQQVNKCHQQLNQLSVNYKMITQSKIVQQRELLQQEGEYLL